MGQANSWVISVQDFMPVAIKRDLFLSFYLFSGGDSFIFSASTDLSGLKYLLNVLASASEV